MQAQCIKFADIDQGKISTIQEVEKKMNYMLVAVESAGEYADLSTGELETLQKKEKELGILLLAYRK